MRILPTSVHAATVSRRLWSWGSTTGSSTDNDEMVVFATAGVDDASGREVVAVLDGIAPQGAPFLEARDGLCFPRPRAMSFGASAQLPALALTISAALLTVGLPPGRASISVGSDHPAKVVMAGGAGRAPALLVQLLAARGARPIAAVGRRYCDTMRELGAAEVLDHDARSWSEEYGAVDAVIDMIGREEDTRTISSQVGAAYASTACPALLSLERDGALAAFRALALRRGTADASVWSAGDDAPLVSRSLAEVFDGIESGALQPPKLASDAVETAEQYGEYISWARDDTSGARFGFPVDPSNDLWRLPPPRWRPEWDPYDDV